ncbi:hypothetical protein B0H17DRAFT_1204497 [Mycena rosella]|uniref:Uncharacterized protein n=1 Tax=Mycena rosella TaxID=1033263 RepID=A0AAD7GDR9_MYCRO|nr:hypothetical protein B0H17DRAFT_1204497 [Mycena rosella]
MPLAQSLRLGQHGSSHASRTTEERLGDEHGGEQTDGSKEEKNSGVAPPPPQQQQDAEGDNAGATAMATVMTTVTTTTPMRTMTPTQNRYRCRPGTTWPRGTSTATRSGFVKVEILTKLAQLKSNNGVALWFTMPNGDVYRDPLRAEAAVSEAGFRNLKVTRGLGDAGMVYLRDRTKREQEKQERSRSRREKTARRAASMSTSPAS